jgi:hypothetical protein
METMFMNYRFQKVVLLTVQRNFKKNVMYNGIGNKLKYEVIPNAIPLYSILDPVSIGVFPKSCVRLVESTEKSVPFPEGVVQHVAVYQNRSVEGKYYTTASYNEGEVEFLAWAEVVLTASSDEMLEAPKVRIVTLNQVYKKLCTDVGTCMVCFEKLKKYATTLMLNNGNDDGTRIPVCLNCIGIYHKGGNVMRKGDVLFSFEPKERTASRIAAFEDDVTVIDGPRSKAVLKSRTLDATADGSQIEASEGPRRTKARKLAASSAEGDSSQNFPAKKRKVLTYYAADGLQLVPTEKKDRSVSMVEDPHDLGFEGEFYRCDMIYHTAHQDIDSVDHALNDDDTRPFTKKERDRMNALLLNVRGVVKETRKEMNVMFDKFMAESTEQATSE